MAELSEESQFIKLVLNFTHSFQDLKHIKKKVAVCTAVNMFDTRNSPIHPGHKFLSVLFPSPSPFKGTFLQASGAPRASKKGKNSLGRKSS